MRKRLQLVSAALVVLVMGSAGVWLVRTTTQSPEAPSPPPENQEREATAVDAGAAADVETEKAQWPAPEPGERIVQAIHEGEPVAARFFIGAPGVYPPLETEGQHAALPEPSETIGGEPVEHYEVFASAQGLAFWGDLEPDSDVVELDAAGSLDLRLVGTPGVPVPDASVRLSRSPLSLVVRSTTSVDGTATFDHVPAGSYWVDVEAPGWLRATRQVEVGEQGGDVEIQLQRGRTVTGVVTAPDGGAMPGAIVALYLSTDGSVPARIVESDHQGRYSVSGIRPGETTAIAVADGYAPSASNPVDTTSGERESYQLDVRLRRAVSLSVRVVTANDDPVSGARVAWYDPGSAAGGAAITDRDGRAHLAGVPTSALVHASIGRFESADTELPPDGDLKLRLQLPGELGPWRMRLAASPAVDLLAFDVVDGDGARCTVTPMDDPRDYVLRGCGHGEATIRFTTSAGALRMSFAFQDGVTVEVPEPEPVSILVRGAEDEQWSATTFELRGPLGTPVEPDVQARSRSARSLTTQLFEGTWTLIVENDRVGRQQFDLEVGEGEVREEVALVGYERHRFIVTDRFGAAVTGAYVMLFDDGRLVEVSRSAGQLPTDFRVRPPFDGQLLVVDPRRGEGAAMLTAPGMEPSRVELDEAILTHRIPSTRPDREALEKLLGARLVSADEGWLLDFERADAPGRNAGLRRADRFVTAWREGGALRVIAYRESAGYLDVTIPGT